MKITVRELVKELMNHNLNLPVSLWCEKTQKEIEINDIVSEEVEDNKYLSFTFGKNTTCDHCEEDRGEIWGETLTKQFCSKECFEGYKESEGL